MTLSNQQLRSWTRQGTVNKSKKTYDLIKKALTACNDKYCHGRLCYDIYLQGSYKNSTNIDDSDIDVIVQLNSVHLSNLPEKYQKISQDNAHKIWNNFKSCIIDIAEEELGHENVSSGNKSIKIDTAEGLSQVDVIPCIEYRNYNANGEYKAGMTFWHNEQDYQIIHYPQKHYYNGIEKQKNTNKSYKSTIRLFKNIRSYLAQENVINKEDSSSYFMECLLYNVPNNIFVQPVNKVVPDVILYLNKTDITNFKQQHNDKDFKLFGNHPEQWDVDKARAILKEMNYWSKN